MSESDAKVNHKLIGKIVKVLDALGIEEIGVNGVYPSITKSPDPRDVIKYESDDASKVISKVNERQSSLYRLNTVAKGKIPVSYFPYNNEVMNLSTEGQDELVKLLDGTGCKIIQPLDAGRHEWSS
jgi:hypothetical protein